MKQSPLNNFSRTAHGNEAILLKIPAKQKMTAILQLNNRLKALVYQYF